MQVLEPYGSRFELALEDFSNGRAFTFRGVKMWLAANGSLGASINSSWRVENTTEQTARADLQVAKDTVGDLVAESSSFAALVKDRPQYFILIHDYGTGSVELCRLVNGALVWAKGMPFSTGAV
jgi:hypothetical protein